MTIAKKTRKVSELKIIERRPGVRLPHHPYSAPALCTHPAAKDSAARSPRRYTRVNSAQSELGGSHATSPNRRCYWLEVHRPDGWFPQSTDVRGSGKFSLTKPRMEGPMRLRLIPYTFALVAIAAISTPATAQLVRSGSGVGATTARDQFRADLGGGTVAGANGSFGGARREINWDGVPDSFSAPNSL